MFVLGLLILAAAVVFAVEFVIANDSGVTFKLWNQTWNIDAFWLGVMGAGFLLAVVLAVALMRVSVARSIRMRSERRQLAKENDRLATRAKHTAPTAANKDYPAAPGYAAPAAGAGASTAYAAPPPAPATPGAAPTGERQAAYANSGAPEGEAQGGKHHRFFSRNSERR